MKECSEIMLSEAIGFLKENTYPQQIIFCLYGEDAYAVFAQTLDELMQKMRSR